MIAEAKPKPRTGDVSRTDLHEYIEELRTRIDEFAATVEAIEQLGVEAVHMDGRQKFDRGLVALDEFRSAVEIALVKERNRMRRARVS